MRKIAILVVLLMSFGLFAQEKKLTDAQIIDKLIAKYSKFYEQYEGVKLVKHVDSKIFDSKSKELLKTRKVKFNAQDFFYKKPEEKAFEFYENGKKEDPDDYKGGKKSEPTYPVFDKDSKKNYTLKIVGSKTHRKIDCYKIKVIPKRKNERLFKGELLVSKKTLSVMYVSGTIAKFPRFMEDFRITVDYKSENFPSETVGEITLQLDVPIFFSDKLIKSKFKTFKPVPIKKK